MQFKFTPSVLAAVVLCTITNAHFVLDIPTSLGFDDELEDVAPCGGFDPHTRTNITNFFTKGSPVSVLTTHLSVTFEFNAAIASNLNHWVPLTRVLNQTGVGEFCEPQIPAITSWAGKQAVLQVIQHGPDGTLYQVKVSLVFYLRKD